MGFAQRLAALRKERGVTQQALADQADMHIVQICRYETGKNEPTLDAIRKLSLALHVRADALIFDEFERMLKSSRNNYFLSMFEPAVSNLQRCPVPVAQDSSIRGHSRDVSKSDCRVDG